MGCKPRATGDRAGISAAADWADDHWTLVASRKIATGSKYDVDFLPGNTFDDPPIVNPGLEPEVTPHDLELDAIVPDADAGAQPNIGAVEECVVRDTKPFGAIMIELADVSSGRSVPPFIETMSAYDAQYGAGISTSSPGFNVARNAW